MTNRRFKILVGVIAVILLVVFLVIRFGGSWEKQPTPVVPQPEQAEEQIEQTEEQIAVDPDERLELFKKAAKQGFQIVGRVNNELHYIYRVTDYCGIREHVFVSFYKSNDRDQDYTVEGRGEKVFEVQWAKTESNPPRTLRYTVKKEGNKLKYEDELSEEEAKELFEKGRQHYFEVRKYFGVDTNEGLEKLLKRESKLKFK